MLAPLTPWYLRAVTQTSAENIKHYITIAKRLLLSSAECQRFEAAPSRRWPGDVGAQGLCTRGRRKPSTLKIGTSRSVANVTATLASVFVSTGKDSVILETNIKHPEINFISLSTKTNDQQHPGTWFLQWHRQAGRKNKISADLHQK